tara:strand:- start:2391 stop:3482 length:1092 start_codon:yes stop_codon:yes gene_type:complete
MTLSVNDFTAGDVITASAMNTNFATIESYVNSSPGLAALTGGTFSGVVTFSAGVTSTGGTTALGTTNITGVVNVGTSGSGQDVYFHSATADDNLHWDASDEVLKLTGTAGQDALSVLAGNVNFDGDLDVDGTTNLDAVDVDGVLTVSDGAAAAPAIAFGSDTDTGIYKADTNRIGFATAGSLKASLTSSGYFLLGTTGGDDFPSTDGLLSIKSSNVPYACYRTSSTATDRLMLGLSDVSSTGTKHFEVEVNGDVENTNNSYGALSDERLKTNITDAKDYISDLRNLRVVNYQFDKVAKEGTIVAADSTGPKLLGLVAQEVEPHLPGLVKTDEDGIKSLKYSVLTPMLLKAIQEIDKRLTALEA